MFTALKAGDNLIFFPNSQFTNKEIAKYSITVYKMLQMTFELKCDSLNRSTQILLESNLIKLLLSN